MKKLDPKNAEVTKKGIKARGDPVKGKQTPVVVKETTVGQLKKRLLYVGTTVMTAAISIGLAADWTPDMVHIAYPTGGLYLMQMLLIRLTKME